MSHSEEKAWVAGFFEGEGCVLITKELVLRVTVTNTDVKLLTKLKELCGGDITKGGVSRKGTHVKRWRIANNKAYGFLRDILPYLVGNKKDEVELALQFEQLMNNGGKRLSEELISARTKIRLGLQILKRRCSKVAS